jgi:hypothetical protein
MSIPNLFEYLVVGLALYFEKGQKYPFPDVLQYSTNVLALAKRSDMPKTFSGLLRLLQEQPLYKWYPFELPKGIDPQTRLLEVNGLSFEAIEYLDQFTEHNKTSIFGLQYSQALNIVTANGDFLQLKRRLEDEALQNTSMAQQEYIRLRRFIIEHPYTTLEALENYFMSSNCIVCVRDVAKLYVEAGSRASSLRFPDTSGQEMYWLCIHCGPLLATATGLESIKVTACGKHCPRTRGGWKAVPISKEVLVLREGIHLRTHLPGIPELALYDWVYQQYEAQYSYMQEPELWPHIDAYDMRLIFQNEVWAVDFKDYKDPYQLAAQLKGIGRHGDKFSRTFYVYPAYREKQRKHYAEIAKNNSQTTRQGAELLSDEAFKEQVEAKIKSMRKGK